MSESHPLRISVVTPSYNQAQFLEETIRSVLDQGYENLEYQVMDGGSTDRSMEVVREYEKQLARWESGPDGGQSAAINKGWRGSTGQVLAWLNADDRYTPGTLSKVAELFRKYPDVGLVYGACYSDICGTSTQRLYQPPAFDFKKLLLENYIPQPTVFIRRSVLDQVGFLDTSLRYCMDYDLWLRCAQAGVRFQRIEGPALARFRVWAGSKTSQDAGGWVAEKLQVLEKIFSNPPASINLKSIKKYAWARAYVTAAYGVSINGDPASARRFLGKALSVTPGILRDPQFFSVVAISLLGNRGSQWIRQLKWSLASS